MRDKEDKKKDRRKAKIGKFIGNTIALSILLLLYKASVEHPEIVENFYSRNLYVFFVTAQSTLFASSKFTFAELLAFLTILSFVALIANTLYKVIVNRETEEMINGLLQLISSVMAFVIFFLCLWGFNYNRVDLAENLGLQSYNQEEREELLYQTCEKLIEDANYYRIRVRENGEEDIFYAGQLHVSLHDYSDELMDVYNDVITTENLYFLPVTKSSVKQTSFAGAMSKLGIQGIYIPYTGEVYVDTNTPDVLLVASILHEMSHQKGIAKEDEANFMAYYIADKSGNMELQYSSTIMALIYSMNELYRTDSAKYTELRETYSAGVNRDLANYSLFLKGNEGKINDLQDDINDQYLKANNQDDGIDSYNQMVELLIQYLNS